MNALELIQSGLGDARLHSFAWTETGIVLDLELPGAAESRRVKLEFDYVTELRIDFECGDVAGTPLTWGAELSVDETGSNRFYLDCQPVGGLSFVYSTVRMV